MRFFMDGASVDGGSDCLEGRKSRRADPASPRMDTHLGEHPGTQLVKLAVQLAPDAGVPVIVQQLARCRMT